MNIYLAGSNGKKQILTDYNKLTKGNYDYLFSRTESSRKETYNRRGFDLDNVKILESFYYVDDYTKKLLPYFGDFLLDSGAFTFMMNSKKGNIDWLSYIDKYAQFIKENNIEKFFELDIDSLVGYEKVKEYRKILENKCGKKCIPVWHKSRGIEEFINLCKNYNYIAIGGIVSKEIKPEEYKYFSYLIKTAHSYNCKIHGLGFTNLSGLTKYHFDSVDSTSWTTGNRFGAVYKFNGKTMEKINKPEGMRLSDSKKVAVHNFNEWVKFQRYAEKNL